MARPAWAITTSAPGSELAGETAAAMAAASICSKQQIQVKHFLQLKAVIVIVISFLKSKETCQKT